MKFFLLPVMLFAVLTAGCAHSPDPVASLTAPAIAGPAQPVMFTAGAEQPLQPAPERSVKAENGDIDGQERLDDFKENDLEGGSAERMEIADPLEPFNRAMYHFNDKLYFWVIKPVAQGYGKVIPVEVRVSVKNFFTNITFPVRFVNCLLQADVVGASTEFGRFLFNTLAGIGGLFDPASLDEVGLAKQDKDLGQTLGFYGLGAGIFIHWPVFGPSSLRDTIGLVGDGFLYPVSYLNPWYAAAGAQGYYRVNDASLRIGDYESVKEAAIDPYVATRDIYVQYRANKVKKAGLKQ